MGQPAFYCPKTSRGDLNSEKELDKNNEMKKRLIGRLALHRL
jgi:hypothetical protein